jgi:hypothetical protein
MIRCGSSFGFFIIFEYSSCPLRCEIYYSLLNYLLLNYKELSFRSIFIASLVFGIIYIASTFESIQCKYSNPKLVKKSMIPVTISYVRINLSSFYTIAILLISLAQSKIMEISSSLISLNIYNKIRNTTPRVIYIVS